MAVQSPGAYTKSLTPQPKSGRFELAACARFTRRPC
jgi:hypothetical protein